MVKVSICIPTYKQVDFLRLTLVSVLEQSFDDYEVIITDDSPDDSVLNLLSEFNFGSRLRYFKNPEPLGSPRNWNEAIAKASADLIKILHHDDRFSHPKALEAFVNLMEEQPEAGFGFCPSNVIDSVKGKSWVHGLSSEQMNMLHNNPELLFLGNVIGAPSATIYRKSLGLTYDKQFKWLVDIDFYIRVLQKNRNFAYTDEVLITTPTNVAHQVTESCKNNAELEIWESSILFLKYSPQLMDNQSVVNHWLGIFGRYGIYSLEHLQNLNKFNGAQKKLLESLLVKFNERPVLRFIYYLYWRLEAPEPVKNWIRLLIRAIYRVILAMRYLLKNSKTHVNL